MSVLAEQRLHRWTRADYDKLTELGFFPNRRVELVEGQIFEMAAMGSAHATAVKLAERAVERAFGPGYFARGQMPLALGERSEPEPDVAVIAGDVRDYADAHPTTAVLVVEIADTSLDYDRQTKGSLYAKAELADYWIVNLNERQVEVYRMPIADDTAPFHFRYADRAVYRAGELVRPLAAPGAAVAVADLLP